MTTSNYLSNRQKYTNGRPQAILFADNPGIEEDGKIVPDGQEFKNFIILSDHNRDPINFSVERIETRKRMINGRQRSYHVADKLKIGTGWKNLPSRGFSTDPDFNSQGITSLDTQSRYTVDGGAGGVDLLNWDESNPGSFWIFLAYDNFKNFESDKYNKLKQYNEVIEVLFEDFSYSVEKRGGSNHDLWNIDLDLEEV